MDSRSRFLIQVLEKLGAPILSAVNTVHSRDASGGERNEAERVAELLTKSVQSGIALASVMDVKGADSGGDSLRLALTALSAPMLSDMYVAAGKMPNENDIRRLVAALQAALTFADNFAPSHENIGRLMGINVNIALLDTTQIEIQFVHALIPAINAINVFSFGQPEKKLAQDVADRLSQRAAMLRKSLFGSITGQPDEKFADIGLLGALASLYATAHRAETEKLMALNDAARTKAAQSSDGLPSMDTVWRSYDKAESMLEAIGRYTAPASSNAGSSSVAPQPVAPPLQTPVQAAPVSQPIAAAPQAAPASPMGFFAKKGDGQQTGSS